MFTVSSDYCSVIIVIIWFGRTTVGRISGLGWKFQDLLLTVVSIYIQVLQHIHAAYA